MKISNEVKERIQRVFPSNEKLRNQLLSGNADAITKLGIVAQKNIEPEEIIQAFENGDMERLYKKSKRMVEGKKLYNELCNCFMEKDER